MFEPGQIIRLQGGMVKKQDRIPVDVLAQMRGYREGRAGTVSQTLTGATMGARRRVRRPRGAGVPRDSEPMARLWAGDAVATLEAVWVG